MSAQILRFPVPAQLPPRGDCLERLVDLLERRLCRDDRSAVTGIARRHGVTLNEDEAERIATTVRIAIKHDRDGKS